MKTRKPQFEFASDISTSLHQILRRSDQRAARPDEQYSRRLPAAGDAASQATVSGLNVTELKLDVMELKLDRLIDDMRFLRQQMIGCNRRLQEIETYLKPSELDEGRELDEAGCPRFC